MTTEWLRSRAAGLATGMVLGIAVAFLAFSVFSSPDGRFRIVNIPGDGPVFLLDSKTGAAWRWAHLSESLSDWWMPTPRFGSESEWVTWLRHEVASHPQNTSARPNVPSAPNSQSTGAPDWSKAVLVPTASASPRRP